MQTAPLRGLDKRVAETRDQIKVFYADRIPAHFSNSLRGSETCK